MTKMVIQKHCFLRACMLPYLPSDWTRSDVFSSGCSYNCSFIGSSRQDTLDLSFWSGHFLTFCTMDIEKVERHLVWKPHRNSKESWSNVPLMLLACIGFLYKDLHKIGRLRKFTLARLNFTFLLLRLSPWDLAHVFIVLVATSSPQSFKCLHGDLVMIFWRWKTG